MTAKQRLVDKIKTWISEHERDAGVSMQMNVVCARGTLEKIEALNLVQAHKVEKAIAAAEERSRKSAEKYGWDPVDVSPLDFAAFIQS